MRKDDLINGFLKFVFIALPFLSLMAMVGMTKPLFKRRCKDCGCKDRNWDLIPIGHDDFAWDHNCVKEKEKVNEKEKKSKG